MPSWTSLPSTRSRLSGGFWSPNSMICHSSGVSRRADALISSSLARVVFPAPGRPTIRYTIAGPKTGSVVSGCWCGYMRRLLRDRQGPGNAEWPPGIEAGGAEPRSYLRDCPSAVSGNGGDESRRHQHTCRQLYRGDPYQDGVFVTSAACRGYCVVIIGLDNLAADPRYVPHNQTPQDA